MNILKVTKWKTNVSSYKNEVIGNASISREKYIPGFYHMEGVNGYEYFEVRKTITITTLHIGDTMVMLDDPLHVYGMKALAKNAVGEVLVAGLGLGIVIHELVKNDNVTSIVVVERNVDVINLISKYLPDDDRIDVVNIDFHDVPTEELCNYNTVILDIWWYGSDESNEVKGRILSEMWESFARVKYASSDTKVFIWGMRNKDMNPAVMG